MLYMVENTTTHDLMFSIVLVALVHHYIWIWILNDLVSIVKNVLFAERQIALQLMGQGEMIDAIVEPIKENVDSDELGQNKIQTKNSELVEGSDPEKEGETSDKDDKVQIDLSSNESQCLEVS